MASLLRSSSRHATTCTRRAFSSSRSLPVSLQWQDNDPEALADAVPPYPYGPTLWYKQSSRGLYGGQRVRYGNNVSDEFEVKTRRSWHPNVKTKRLFSKALNRHVQVRVTTKVLRTIDKLGGLDEYLLGEKEGRIKELGESGWWLRWAVMQTPVVKQKFAAQRAALGLSPVESGPAEESMSEMSLAEADAGVEAAAQETENAEGVEGAVAVPMDDAFEIEQPVDLPPLKFRVAPHQHLYLTPTGWKRVREDPNRRLTLAKERLFREYHQRNKKQTIEELTDEFDRRQKALELRRQSLVQTANDTGTLNAVALSLREEAKKTVQNFDKGPNQRGQAAAESVGSQDSDTGAPSLRSSEWARLRTALNATSVEEIGVAIKDAQDKILDTRMHHMQKQLRRLSLEEASLAAERKKTMKAASKEFNAYARQWAEDYLNQRLAERQQRQQVRTAAKKMVRSERRAQLEAEEALS